MSLAIGVDLGTSAVKAVALDDEGPGAAAAARTPWAVHAGITACDPEAIVDVTRRVLARAAAHRRVDSIGIAGFAESFVALGPDGRPVAPIIAWHDPIGADCESRLREDFSTLEFLRRTGQLIGRRLTIVKLRWLAREQGAKIARVLSVPEWVAWRLGAECAPEPSLWSRTGLLRADVLELDPDLLAWAGVPRPIAASLQPAGSPGGTVEDRRLATGINGATLSVCGHDHLCASHGAAADRPEVVFDSWGNGEAMLRVVGSAVSALEEIERRGASVSWDLDGRRRMLFCGLGTGLMLRRVLEAIGIAGDRPASLDREAVELDAGDAPPLTLGPDGSPVIAEPATASPAHLWRAALDTAARRAASARAWLERGWGPIEETIACGGWYRSPAIIRHRRDAIPDLRVERFEEPGALGAAKLAVAGALA